jgi:hypothetical protein
MESEGSSPNSQELSACPYPAPDQCSSHHPILYLHCTAKSRVAFSESLQCKHGRDKKKYYIFHRTEQWLQYYKKLRSNREIGSLAGGKRKNINKEGRRKIK